MRPFELTPGAWYWHGQAQDRVCVRLLIHPESRIDVGIWWNRNSGPADVHLLFGLYRDSVELGCLTGNGFNAPGFHRLGFGTFVVNIAVQALQALRVAPTIVEGVLSNTDEFGLEPEERLRLEANRRAFWRRFGLDVVADGDPPLDYLRGHVGEMRVVDSGTVAGQFPRLVPLHEFSQTRPQDFAP